MIAAALAACGAPPCSESCAALRVVASPHLDPEFDLLVTDDDRAVSASVGQKIEVYLVQPPGMAPWADLVADDPAVLQPVNVLTKPPRSEAAVAGFAAEERGVATITVYASPGVCGTNEPCPPHAILFNVRVTVS